LPIAGAATGGYFGGPAGAQIGGQLAGVFGKQLELLPPEEQELEAAKRLVRMAAAATSNAARGSQTSASPEQIVRKSLEIAARRHAPGLLRRARPSAPTRAGRKSHARKSQGRTTYGRWVKRGRTIKLFEV
jgi:hypothetical protein